MILHDGNQHGMQLHLTPAGARALFGFPAGELAAAAVPLDALPDAAPRGRAARPAAVAAGLGPALRDPRPCAHRGRRSRRPIRPRRAAAAAMRRLVATPGVVPIASPPWRSAGRPPVASEAMSTTPRVATSRRIAAAVSARVMGWRDRRPRVSTRSRIVERSVPRRRRLQPVEQLAGEAVPSEGASSDTTGRHELGSRASRTALAPRRR